jgi:hypothetical protein
VSKDKYLILEKSLIIDEKPEDEADVTAEVIDPLKELEIMHASAKMTDNASGVDHYFDF